MLSAAVSGSVSDSTKATPQLTVNSIKYQLKDAGNNNIGSQVTITSGNTSPDIQYGGTSTPQATSALVVMNVSFSATSGGGRATNNPHSLEKLGVINADATVSTCTMTEHEAITGGDMSKQIGNWEPPGEPDNEPQYSNIIENTVKNGGATADIDFDNFVLFNNPEVFNGIINSATGQFRVPQNSMHILNQNTGVYTTGPADHFDVYFKIIK